VRVLGIDPGSVTTGYGVIEQTRSGPVLIEQGSIRTKRDASFPSRLQTIFEGLVQVIGRASPEAVAVESPFAGKNVRSLVQLAHARGVALLAAQLAGLEVFEYPPSTVKVAVVGYGRAEKQQVAKMVSLLLPATRELKLGADAADALAVALCHVQHAMFTRRIKKT